MRDDLNPFSRQFVRIDVELWPASEWQPLADVYQTPQGWLIKFDLAGVRPTDLDVHVAGNRVTVRGCRRDWVVEETSGCCAHSLEIAYSTFARSVELPEDLHQLQLATRYREGMLLVELLKAGE